MEIYSFNQRTYIVMLSILIANRLVAVGLLILSLIIAYSRIYLLQHFLLDIVAGAFIGAGTAFLTWYVFSIIQLPGWSQSRIPIRSIRVDH